MYVVDAIRSSYNLLAWTHNTHTTSHTTHNTTTHTSQHNSSQRVLLVLQLRVCLVGSLQIGDRFWRRVWRLRLRNFAPRCVVLQHLNNACLSRCGLGGVRWRGVGGRINTAIVDDCVVRNTTKCLAGAAHLPIDNAGVVHVNSTITEISM